MASLKEIKKRITSVKNTQKVTKAMKLVAAAKLRRAQQAALASRAYVDELAGIVGRVSASAGEDAPRLMQAGQSKDTTLVVLTSDRGLCGGFNENLIRATAVWIQKTEADNSKVHSMVFGRKGCSGFTRLKIPADLRAEEMADGSLDELVNLIVKEVSARFISDKSGKVILAYNRFVSAGRQEIFFENLLPFGSNETTVNTGFEHIYEPSKSEMIQTLIEDALEGSVRQALLDSRASELAARMMAMDNATKNASEMIDDLTLEFNRARQAAITGELLDILGGAAALNG